MIAFIQKAAYTQSSLVTAGGGGEGKVLQKLCAGGIVYTVKCTYVGRVSISGHFVLRGFRAGGGENKIYTSGSI
jgi:hypothetical protein